MTTPNTDKRDVSDALKKLQLGINALSTIAAWGEGSEVTSRFDEPHAARIARAAIETINAAEQKDAK